MSSAYSEVRVTRLTVYPVKGLGGQPRETVEVQERGFAWDRRWMLIGEDHVFLSQRQHPKLATIRAAVNNGELSLSHGNDQIGISVVPPSMAKKLPVTIWRDQVEAVLLPDIGAWFSDVLDYPCELVFMPATTRRAVNPAYSGVGDIVGFADAYPVLLIGEASLADLNTRLGSPVPMNRFRPNIVVSTEEPFAEDQWGELEIGSALFAGAKASARCAVPTVDQLTGERTGPEPIRTLSKYRRVGEDVFLGQNLLVRRTGSVALEDRVRLGSRIEPVYR